MESPSNDRDVRRLEGSATIPLDDPSASWIVQSGKLAVFLVSRRRETDGPRQHLLDIESGELLHGLPRPREESPGFLLAMALEPTLLRRTASPLPAEPLQRWTRGLGRAMGIDEEPAAAAAESDAALRSFHAEVVERIERRIADETKRQAQRFELRERQNVHASHEAVAQLTSVLIDREEPHPDGSDLFIAAQLAARAAGTSLKPPADDEASAETHPVEAIAAASHVRARRVVLHDRWWAQESGPLLAFGHDDRRPLALIPHARGGYDCYDPHTGQSRVVSRQLASEIDPAAWLFYPPLPQDASTAWGLMRFALRGRMRDLLTILLTGIAATLLGMLMPQVTAILVDGAIPDGNRTLLWQLGLGLFAASVGSAMFRLSQSIAMLRVETAADNTTQAAVWDRLLNLQLSFFRRFSTGDLQSRVNAISGIRAYLGGTTMRTLFGSVILLLNFGLLLYYSPTLTAVAAAVALLSIGITVGSGIMILRRTRVILEMQGKFFGLMVQLINGVAKLRVAAAEERAFARWAGQYSKLLRLELGQRRIADTVRVVNLAVGTLSSIALFAVAAGLIRETHGLSTGIFLAFNVAYGTFIGAIVSLSNTLTDVMAIAILRERARPILETLPEVTAQKAHPGRLRGRVTLDHVSFRYDSEGPLIIDEVALTIEAGQFVAFVGPSGSGKSTLLRLILGFESPNSGSIHYDGQELAGLDVHAVRRQMGVVLQTGRINAGSLIENISTGAQVSLNDAWEAARACGFAGDIEAMPMGMHTVISEGGTNLSGGQRQRLLLTRALVHRPAILLLDEATSALDNNTQAVVSRSLRQLAVTRVVIAHRLSTIRDADRIYVIDAGRILQQGSFEQLAAQPGLFARLMARQLA